MNKILDLSLNPSDPIEKALFKKFIKIEFNTTIGRLSRILEKELFVVVDDREETREFETLRFKLKTFFNFLFNFVDENKQENKETQNGDRRSIVIITQKDLLRFLPIN
jgi:hypothetical protein